MHILLFNGFHEIAQEKGIIFYYSGSFSQNVVATMADALKKRLESLSIRAGQIQKIFSTFVEMAQNINHYASDDIEGSIHVGAMAVGIDWENKFYVLCTNTVKMENVERIREKLEPLKQMQMDEIKRAYRVQLRNDSHADDTISKGAGLGFLTIAKDSAEPIEYEFKPTTNPLTANFILKATL